MNLQLRDEAVSGFAEHFGGAPTHLVWAPGRINLIGEHTDYHSGMVFPCAIERGIVIAARIGKSNESCIISDADPDVVRLRLSQPDGLLDYPKWVKYALGVPALFGLQQNVPQIEAFVTSNLPLGAGLSSSAAIETGFGELYRAWLGRPESRLELAKLAQKAENEIVGSPCGLMDQIAVLMGQPNHALLISFGDPISINPVPLPSEIGIVVCDTGEKHDIGESGYPARRSQSMEAAQILGFENLGRATLADVEGAKAKLGDLRYRRAKHVVTENQRCRDFAVALQNGQLSQLGELMHQSHMSLKNDYEVSSAALDTTQEIASQLTDCIGVRMTGGGFGGACIALVRSGADESVAEMMQLKMLDRGITNAHCFPVQASSGVFVTDFEQPAS